MLILKSIIIILLLIIILRLLLLLLLLLQTIIILLIILTAINTLMLSLHTPCAAPESSHPFACHSPCNTARRKQYEMELTTDESRAQPKGQPPNSAEHT